jgi:F-type H+-transporting ATPase subunit b
MAQSHFVEELESEVSHLTQKPGFFAPDVSMMLLTWVTFFIMLGILYKFAWRPILTALDQREEKLRKSLEEADRLTTELEQINQTRQEIVQKAQSEGKLIVEESRHAAIEAAQHIREKARGESQILLENAKREIHDATEKARAVLKQESIDTAVKLAGKLIEENIDQKKNKRIIDEFIKES